MDCIQGARCLKWDNGLSEKKINENDESDESDENDVDDKREGQEIEIELQVEQEGRGSS